MSLFGTVEQISVPVPGYKYITKEEDARSALSYLDNFSILEIDTEGTALDPYECRTTLVQIGVPGEVFVFDVRSDLPDISVHGSLFKPLFTDKTKLKLLQNCNYDMKVIKVQFGYYIENVYDTMLAEMLMTLGIQMRGFTLAALVNKYLHMIMGKEPRGTFQDYGQVFTKNQLDYAASDVITLDIIRNMQMPRIKQFGLEQALDLEMRFTKPLAEMELNGIRLDVDKWKIIMKQAAEEAAELKGLIEVEFEPTQDQTTLFGVSTINIDSPSQLKASLGKLGIQVEKTDVEALERYKGHPIVDNILTYRKLQKLGSTYGEALINRINPKTGKLHTEFQQMVSTGRLSSRDPNLQNIPGKQKYRTCFIADEGYDLFTADRQGAELRIMGDLSGEPNFIKAYREGIDLHTLNASNVFKVDFGAVTKFQRGASKAVTFGLCVREDTNIITNNGTKFIEDASVGERVAHDAGEDFIIDHKYMGEKECFELITQYGYSLEATDSHEIKVIDLVGEYTTKSLKDLDTKKDFVCVKRNSRVFNDKDYTFNLEEFDFGKFKKDIPLPEIMTKEFAKFLGLFVSEGHLHKNGRGTYNSLQFGFSDKIPEFISVVGDIFSGLFGNRPKKSFKQNEVHFDISSTKLAEFLRVICKVDEDKTDTITIPDCVKLSSIKIQRAFISALFEGDGTIWQDGSFSKSKYDSKSKKLIKDLQLMLLNFGILSSVHKKFDKRYPDEDYYSLVLVGKAGKKTFIEDVGFLTNNKQGKYVENPKAGYPSFNVPYQKERLLKIKEFVKKSSGEEFSGKLDCSSVCGKKGFNLRHHLNTWINNSLSNKDGLFKITESQLKVFRKLDPFLEFIYDNNIVPLPIKSITSVGKHKVYDISVESRELFLANGFIVHNCYGMSPVGLSKRLKISKDEATSIINAYFVANPALKRWLDGAAKSAVSNRYSTSVSGRKRFFNIPPASDPTRKAIVGHVGRQGMNAPVQGANADIIKEAMVICVDKLEKLDYDAKLLLTVHDELVCTAEKGHREEVAKIVVDSLVEGFAKYFNTIPMESEALIGDCWLKSKCEDETSGTKCGGTETLFVPDEKYGTKLVCGKCGANL